MQLNNINIGPIGVFDSGYGGLTVLSEIQKELPQYDYIYFGDNLRSPYGNRPFDVVYKFTLEAIEWFFSKGCNLVILACNTVSSNVLRSIQQEYLPKYAPQKKVLGIIKPTVEILENISKKSHIGILATSSTIESKFYEIEINKLYPDIVVTSEPCPMFVPLVENEEYNNPGADYFVNKYLSSLIDKDKDIDSIILGCTHYPFLLKKIQEFLPKDKKIKIISQGNSVAYKLREYLFNHPEIDNVCSKNKLLKLYTTGSKNKFESFVKQFFHKNINVEHI